VLVRALLLARGAAAAAAAASSSLCGGIEAALHGLSAGFFFSVSAARMPLNISFTSLLALMHAVEPLASAKMLSPPKWPRTLVQLLHANSRRQKLHEHIKVE
jgi:hypothetical protein